jgi:hypothetical protein
MVQHGTVIIIRVTGTSSLISAERALCVRLKGLTQHAVLMAVDGLTIVMIV